MPDHRLCVLTFLHPPCEFCGLAAGFSGHCRAGWRCRKQRYTNARVYTLTQVCSLGASDYGYGGGFLCTGLLDVSYKDVAMPKPSGGKVDQATRYDTGVENLQAEPYYAPQGDEVNVFEAAYQNQLPVLLKGPTGCGKTRFVEYMAWRLQRPLVTVACHDDLTAGDLVGRFLIRGGETLWTDGPLTRAARAGAICYLDEIVEARKDTTVVIHPLADDRRRLPIDKLGEVIEAAPGFTLVISYNPGYQSVLKDLKQSTRQRFVALEFNYPKAELEIEIVTRESGVDREIAQGLVRFAHMTRNLKGSGLEEGASTRLLVHAARLIQGGISPERACRTAVAQALTDDPELLAAVHEFVTAVF